MIVDVDTEFGFADGDGVESSWQPVIFCASEDGDHFHFWRDDPRLDAYLRDRDSRGYVFRAHNVTAEIKYILRLGFYVPQRWWDTMVAYRYLTNTQPNRPPSGLDDVTTALGYTHLVFADKSGMQRRIGKLDFDWNDGEFVERIKQYCYSDCECGRAIGNRMRDKVPAERMAVWSQYLMAISRMELRGVPIDMAMFHRITSHRDTLVDIVKADINSEVTLFDDKGTFKKAWFFAWAEEMGVDWPTRRSPTTGKRYLSLDNDTMKEMESRHPFIAKLRQSRKTIASFQNRSIVIDEARGRHYFNTNVFGTVTSRNSSRRFLFAGPKWWRFMVMPPAGYRLAHVDVTGEEIGVAAAESGDDEMRRMYEQTDPHMYFAIQCGAAPATATKKTHKAIRNKFKTVSLGLLYGRTSHGLAKGLGISKSEASYIVAAHRRMFPKFWKWVRSKREEATKRGELFTRLGWRAIVPIKTNVRTWTNYPIQGSSADILRSAMIYLDQQNVQTLALIHDAAVCLVRTGEEQSLETAIDIAFRQAIDDCYPQFPMRWELEVFESRFVDEDGQEMWQLLSQSLHQIERGINGTKENQI